MLEKSYVRTVTPVVDLLRPSSAGGDSRTQLAPRRGDETEGAGGAKIGLMGKARTEARTQAPCRECLAGRPHCHGTLIRHGGPAARCTETECTEPDCFHPEVLLHSLTIDCEAVGCDCGVEPGARRAAI